MNQYRKFEKILTQMIISVMKTNAVRGY